MEIELREVTSEVLDDLRAQVVLPPHQADWVGGSVDDALLEAAELPEGHPWPRGVYHPRHAGRVRDAELERRAAPAEPLRAVVPLEADGRPSSPGHGRRHGRGAARRRLRQGAWSDPAADQLLPPRATTRRTRFYVGLGFVPTGEYAEWNEEILVLTL